MAQKPGKGQEWAIYEGAKVRFLQGRQKSTSRGPRVEIEEFAGDRLVEQQKATASPSSLPFPQNTQPDANELKSHGFREQVVLPLGKFLVPTGGRDPVFVTPELDPVSGETKLQVEPAGGFARFGGERYAFMDFSYQRLLQSDLSLSSVPSLSIGLHQDLGRLGKLELMAEGWVQASVLETQLSSTVDVGVGIRLRVALPF